jgi:glycosyltransferase involved in cell wall biosynthesis
MVMNVKVRHPNHPNIMTFIDGKQITIKDHEGWTDFDTAVKLIDAPFGYEWCPGSLPFNPETWTKEHKIITWNHIMPYYEGYGYVGQMMLKGLTNIGIDARVFYKSDASYINREALEALWKDRSFDSWGIWHHFWMKPNMMPHKKRAMYTMWESTKLNEGWVSACNEVNLLFVPCQENVEIFQKNGVTTQIEVVEHGVDQEYYYYRPKVKKDKFRIGTMGSLVPRKDPELLIRAFLDEFKDQDDVELYLKDTNEDTEIERKYKDEKQLIFNGKKLSPLEVGEILASFDIAVFPSHGEGFGLGGLQAMGCGTTCICTGWCGYKQYLNPEYNYELKYKLVDIDKVASNNTTYSGQWAQGDYEHLRQLLRYAYDHQDEIHDKGRRAAQWVKEHWTWERAAKQIVDAIDKWERQHGNSSC